MTNPTKPIALLAAFLALPLLSAAAKPNVVIIMADDIGRGDLSFYQRETGREKITVATPNIDRLIDSGMRFSDAHSPASLCAPTRFSMLTGNFSYRNSRPYGVWTPNADPLIEPNFTTVARIAKKGGYHTAFFGKWGLGGSWLTKKTNWKTQDGGALYFGYDYAVELPEGIQNKPFAFYENQKFMPMGENSTLIEIDAKQTRYDTAKKHKDRGGIGDSNWDPTQAGPILAKKAVAYIDSQTAKHPDEPFYLYYCSQAVHIPHTPPAELDGVKIAGTTAGNHGDMILELDVQVGMLVKALKKAGVYDNTLLIFTSDNGGLSEPKMKKAGHDSSAGLSGKKGSIHEGGHRIPFVAVWPGKIKPGSISNEPIVGHDTVATIAALAGQSIDRMVVKDSVNLLPILTKQVAEERHACLLHQSKGGPFYALRDGSWKLILKGKKPNEMKNLKPVELYNFEKTAVETPETNLIKNPEHEQRVKNMTAKYLELRESGAPTITN